MKHLHQPGFTLIELMITIAIFSGVAAAGYTMYVSQQKSYVRQELVSELQQNIRAASYYLENDIRMAGYDPTEKAGAGITIAEPGRLAVTADIGRERPSEDSKDTSYDLIPDGIINSSSSLKADEQIMFALQNDDNFDGIPDDTEANGQPKVTILGKQFNGTGGLQPILEGVEGLEFLYHLSDGTTVPKVSASGLSRIRSVTVSLLLRTRSRFPGLNNKNAYYYPASNPTKSSSGTKWGPFNDSFLRRLVITEIKMRNMGLISNT